MPHSEEIATRLRELLTNSSIVCSEKVELQSKMGGVTFMIDGKVCIRAHSDGGIMVRCLPDLTEELLEKEGVSRFQMKGKPRMKGWLVVAPEFLKSKKQLEFWVKTGLAALPSK